MKIFLFYIPLYLFSFPLESVDKNTKIHILLLIKEVVANLATLLAVAINAALPLVFFLAQHQLTALNPGLYLAFN